ncbi:MAG: 4Fe-4S binding protein [Pseudomonadota bacterium]
MYMLDKVLRNVSTKYATRLYPVQQREHFAEVRGTLLNNIEDCIFCKSCQLKCPSQCLTVDPKAGTWTCETFACVGCGVCVSACPTKCLSMSGDHRTASPEKFQIAKQGTPKVRKAKAKV